MDKDNRRDERFAVRVPVVVTLNARELKGVLADLSLSGARVHVPNIAIKIGTQVILSAVLPPSAPVSLYARVVWTHDAGSANTTCGLALEGPSNPRVVGFCRVGIQHFNSGAHS